jgi:hypothetical protein
MDKFKETIAPYLRALLIPVVLVSQFAAPLTFVWLIYNDAKSNHVFLKWIVFIFLDVILATIWPVYWIIYFITS